MSDKLKLGKVDYLIHLTCECGNTLTVPKGKWEINIVGMIQFKCSCGVVINAPAALAWE